MHNLLHNIYDGWDRIKERATQQYPFHAIITTSPRGRPHIKGKVDFILGHLLSSFGFVCASWWFRSAVKRLTVVMRYDGPHFGIRLKPNLAAK